MSSKPMDKGGHALVIGSSMAGLLATRVLSDYFTRVSLLERDAVQDRPESRKGQPQTRHLHGLLERGRSILDRLFPGVVQALVDGGAVTGDMGEAMRWYHFDGYRVQFTCGLNSLHMSRPFLEWHIRRRVLALPNVTLIPLCRAEKLITTPDRASVAGVEVTYYDEGKRVDSIEADLVVDATGRGSASPKWLQALGYERPAESKVKVNIGYATRTYRRRPGDLVGADLIMIVGTPPHCNRGAYMFPVEDDRWMLTAAGFRQQRPPSDEEGFYEFIRNLPAPDAFNIIRHAEPLSDIVTHNFPSNQRRHYEKLTRFPEGYLVIGDAVGSFNPIYGQGMSSAAMQADLLNQILSQRTDLHGLWRPYFKAVGKLIDIPWQLAVGEDFRYPGTEGPKPFATDQINAYVARVHKATHHDPVVYKQFLKVMNLIAPATSLMHPRIARRVLYRRNHKTMPVPHLAPTNS